MRDNWSILSDNVSTVVDFEFGGDVPGRHKGLAAKKPNASRTGANLLIEQDRSGRRYGGDYSNALKLKRSSAKPKD